LTISSATFAAAPPPQVMQVIERENCCLTGCTKVCNTLGDKCDNMGARANHCFLKRCAEPAAVAACHDEKPYLCCPPHKSWAGGVGKLIASWTCCLPTEVVCCPIYTLCGGSGPAKCLCLDDGD